MSQLKAKSDALRTGVLNWLQRSYGSLDVTEGAVMLGVAVIVGAATGLASVLFGILINAVIDVRHSMQDVFGEALGLFLIMGAAGLIVGYIIFRWAPETRGSGIPAVMESVAMRSGFMRKRIIPLKILNTSLTVGAGGSAGREGPIVQIGGAIGSVTGRWLHLSETRVQALVACGAAAGIAATFNAPIAGAIFALEVIFGRFATQYFGAVVISAVTGGIIGRIFISEEPAFTVPAYPLNSTYEIPVYILLGIAAAAFSIFFIKVRYKAEDLFGRLKIHPSFVAAIGMLMVAALAQLPSGELILGSGLQIIDVAVTNDYQYPILLLASMLILKAIATSITLGSGNSGGVFAPSLFMGAALGGLIGRLGNVWRPDIIVDPGAYAIVGMAAVFSGMARAPMTAIIIVFEMSNDYQLILPLMLATVLSTVLSEWRLPDSIYILQLKRRGVNLRGGRDTDVLQSVVVSEVMTRNMPVITADTDLLTLSRQFSITHAHGFPVVDDNGKLSGVVTLSDLERSVTRHEDEQPHTVGDIATPRHRVVVVHPDETMGDALARMSVRGIGRLPVVDRDHPDELLGQIRRSDIIRAYNLALARRYVLEHKTERMRVHHENADFVDLVLDEHDPITGKQLKEIAETLPEGCVLVSIRRGTRVIIPHGTTVFYPGDHVTAFVREQDAAEFLRCFHADDTRVD
jgi:CIC family chloride channel protein